MVSQELPNIPGLVAQHRWPASENQACSEDCGYGAKKFIQLNSETPCIYAVRNQICQSTTSNNASDENFNHNKQSFDKSEFLQGSKTANFHEGQSSRSDCGPMNCSQLYSNIFPSITTLQRSMYLKPAQELLSETVCVSDAADPASEKHKKIRGSLEMAFEYRSEFLRGGAMTRQLPVEKHTVRIKLDKLALLLHELESRYEQYLHHIQTVISSFEVIAGQGAAASYTALTIQAMCKHFCNLRDAILRQIYATKTSLYEDTPNWVLPRDQILDPCSRKEETLLRLSMITQHHVCKPLRGLPDKSVAVLRAWLFEHFLHPYPSDNEKLMLAKETGLTKNQISNWFINARVRLWKPMIEKMYTDEFAGESRDSNLSP